MNSIAILSDAVHDLGDSFSLGLSWYLDKKSHQKADSKYSFGYARFSLLGAAINSIVIILSSVYLIYEAINRIVVSASKGGRNGIVRHFGCGREWVCGMETARRKDHE